MKSEYFGSGAPDHRALELEESNSLIFQWGEAAHS